MQDRRDGETFGLGGESKIRENWKPVAVHIQFVQDRKKRFFSPPLLV